MTGRLHPEFRWLNDLEKGERGPLLQANSLS